MALYSFVDLALCLLVSLLAVPAFASPVNSTAFTELSGKARGILERSTPAAPHWVVYADAYQSGVTGPPAASAIEGFNVFALSFLLIEGAWDKAAEWTTLTSSERSAIKAEYAAAGISLIVSVFGSTDIPTTTGADPVATANTMAAWVIEYDLDGIDVDYEDFAAMNSGVAEAWLTSFTTQLRVHLPQGSYILTHAPVAPWFTPTHYPGGGYLKVHANVGSLIDWYNVQFYNQGATEYTTCTGLLTTSSSTWPKTALFQIANSGVPLNKLVIGKPATASDASSGYMTTSTLASCLQTARNQGWNAGAMVWQYPDAGVSWIATVRSLSWAV
ncbi:glycoside hydrolase family 18 protein [Desarmillaria tabescens]|uniref:Glycoside hydrolase family 18 protein n=1 Tax=Armillaria tabescens TaxID=1929756 RepID=A0AA39NK44_ARMTA|nr:glycoside hydrolase family 18 protein [Desarmillaria tabescens]KAK0467057.1 glycoside hydrolase family 18 protein [Desarmillaria tabescens]